MKSSDLAGSLSIQSASLPGRLEISNTPFRLVSSRAFLAASLAKAASIIFEIIFLASLGCSSNQLPNTSLTQLSTTGLISEETNLSFVWLENLGSGSFTDRTHVIPSLASSPVICILSFFA